MQGTGSTSSAFFALLNRNRRAALGRAVCSFRSTSRSLKRSLDAVYENAGVVKVDYQALFALDNSSPDLVRAVLADVHGYLGDGKNGLGLHKVGGFKRAVANGSLIDRIKSLKLVVAYPCIGKDSPHSAAVYNRRFGLVLVLVDDLFDAVVHTGDDGVIKLITANIGEHCPETLLFAVGGELEAAVKHVLDNGKIGLLRGACIVHNAVHIRGAVAENGV